MTIIMSSTSSALPLQAAKSVVAKPVEVLTEITWKRAVRTPDSKSPSCPDHTATNTATVATNMRKT